MKSLTEGLYELYFPNRRGPLWECHGPREKREYLNGELWLLHGWQEVLSWFRCRLGPSAQLSIVGPDTFLGTPGSYQIISGVPEEAAYALPYTGPTKPHPVIESRLIKAKETPC